MAVMRTGIFRRLIARAQHSLSLLKSYVSRHSSKKKAAPIIRKIEKEEVKLIAIEKEIADLPPTPAPDFTEEIAEIPEDEYVIVTYDYRLDKRDASRYIKHVTKDRPIRIWIPHADFDVIEYQGRKNEIARKTGGAVWNVQ